MIIALRLATPLGGVQAGGHGVGFGQRRLAAGRGVISATLLELGWGPFSRERG
jgi:hypothetical protein